jgi:hypothetical protein
MTENKLASDVDEPITITVVVSLTVLCSTAFSSSFVICVIVDISRSTVVAEGLIEVMCTGGLSLSTLLT